MGGALVVFDPFGIDLAIYANASVKRGSRSICSVSVRGRLRGPGPWIIDGQARIEVLFFDVDVEFAMRIGREARAPVQPVRVVDRLMKALADPRAWSADVPPGPFVLDHMQGLVPPGAELAVTQRDVPLSITLARIGASPIDGPRRFDMQGLSVGGEVLAKASTLHEPFAPAQFLDLDDAEKLSAPGYAEMPSGARFGSSDEVDGGRMERVGTGRACFVIDAPDDEPEAARTVRAVRVPPRRPDRRRAAVRLPPTGRIGVAEESWQASGEALDPDGTGGTSHAQARERAGRDGTVARSAEVAA